MDKYYFESGSSCYKVDGTEYKIDIKKDPSYPETDQPVVFATDAKVQYRMNLLKAEIELLPASAGNVTVGKAFSDVDSAYTDVMAAVAIDDIMKIVLIVIGVIVGIVHEDRRHNEDMHHQKEGHGPLFIVLCLYLIRTVSCTFQRTP